jgi:hypothetical protein
MQKVSGQLGATIPDDWDWKESHTFLAKTLKTNVIFSSEPLGPDIDSERYASAQGELLSREFPKYREIAFESMRMMDGRQGYMRRFAWEPPDEAEVTQVQLYCAEDSRGFTATATAATSNFAALESILLEILESLSISGESAGGPPATLAEAMRARPLSAS